MLSWPKDSKAITFALSALRFQPSVTPKNHTAGLSSRSRCVHTLYGPLSDFGLDPSDGARSQGDLKSQLSGRRVATFTASEHSSSRGLIAGQGTNVFFRWLDAAH